MKPLILWGGTDINSALYSKEPLRFTQRPDKDRDAEEVKLAQAAFFDGRPIIGVCRGAQLLCVLNGGSLYQHSEGHNKNHTIHTADGKVFSNVAADHHQIMIPVGQNYAQFAYSTHSTKVWEDETTTKILNVTPEIIWWPDTKCLAVQPHPEWEPKGSEFNKWLNELIASLDISYQF